LVPIKVKEVLAHRLDAHEHPPVNGRRARHKAAVWGVGTEGAPQQLRPVGGRQPLDGVAFDHGRPAAAAAAGTRGSGGGGGTARHQQPRVGPAMGRGDARATGRPPADKRGG